MAHRLVPTSPREQAAIRALADVAVKATAELAALLFEAGDIEGHDKAQVAGTRCVEVFYRYGGIPSGATVDVSHLATVERVEDRTDPVVLAVRAQLETDAGLRILVLVPTRDRELMHERLRVGLADIADPDPQRPKCSFIARRAARRIRDPGVRIVSPGDAFAGIRADIIIGRAALIQAERGGAWWDACVVPRLARLTDDAFIEVD